MKKEDLTQTEGLSFALTRISVNHFVCFINLSNCSHVTVHFNEAYCFDKNSTTLCMEGVATGRVPVLYSDFTKEWENLK